jgi:hypothetical protein
MPWETIEYDFWYDCARHLPNSVDLHGFYLNILFIFNSLHQVCIGIEIANMENKESVELNLRELSPDFWSFSLAGRKGWSVRPREWFPSRKRWEIGGSFGQRLLSVSGLPKLSDC